jgi:hypothetical protein
MNLPANTKKVGRDRPGLRSISEVDRARRGILKSSFTEGRKGHEAIGMGSRQISKRLCFCL